jgi:hypothetical protein
VDSTTLNQSVTAALLDAGGNAIHLPVGFNANLSVATQVAYDPKTCVNLAGVKTVDEALDKLCNLGTGKDPGVHIIGVRLIGGPNFLNDRPVKVNEFIKGVEIGCDDELDPATFLGNPDQPFARPVCRMTLELPYFMTDANFWQFNGLIGYTPVFLDGEIQVAGKLIRWLPTDALRTFLTKVLFNRINRSEFPPVVQGWLTVLGNFTWAKDNPELFLDGDTFGVRASGGLSEPTRLRFPSGGGRRGGDFRMWFYLVP